MLLCERIHSEGLAMQPLTELCRCNQQQRQPGKGSDCHPMKPGARKKPHRRKANLKRTSHVALWQITLPVCVLGIFAISCWTAIHMENGSLSMEFASTRNGQRIKVNIAKSNLPTTIAERESESPRLSQ